MKLDPEVVLELPYEKLKTVITNVFDLKKNIDIMVEQMGTLYRK